jgi:prevent-host-death family protein
MSTTYTLTEATRRTAELVNEARYGQEPILITDHGKTAAAVISPQLLDRYRALEDAADMAVIAEIKKRGPQWISGNEAQEAMEAMLAEADAADQTR